MTTTNKQFQIFKAEVERLVELFGLTHWNLYILHEGEGEFVCSIGRNIEKMTATIKFSKKPDLGEKMTEEFIKEGALHEVVHLLIGELAEMASCPFLTESELYSEEEKLVNRLTKILNADTKNYPKRG